MMIGENARVVRVYPVFRRFSLTPDFTVKVLPVHKKKKK